MGGDTIEVVASALMSMIDFTAGYSFASSLTGARELTPCAALHPQQTAAAFDLQPAHYPGYTNSNCSR
jgi:hypothetical protein